MRLSALTRFPHTAESDAPHKESCNIACRIRHPWLTLCTRSLNCIAASRIPIAATGQSHVSFAKVDMHCTHGVWDVDPPRGEHVPYMALLGNA